MQTKVLITKLLSYVYFLLFSRIKYKKYQVCTVMHLLTGASQLANFAKMAIFDKVTPTLSLNFKSSQVVRFIKTMINVMGMSHSIFH